MWLTRRRLNEQVLLHPAVLEGKMSYTVIGCGDFYDQDRETTWCPWTQEDVDKYVIHGIGDFDAKADYTLIGDLLHAVGGLPYTKKQCDHSTHQHDWLDKYSLQGNWLGSEAVLRDPLAWYCMSSI